MREPISVCTYNLHGYHDNDPSRYHKIAIALSQYQPDFCLLQECIKLDNHTDTASLIAQSLQGQTGHHYHRHFTHCHLYMDKFPEGVAVLCRHPMQCVNVIDLNTRLNYGVRPAMPRYAPVIITEFTGKKILLSSIHLDYNPNPIVRLAQAEKLLVSLLNTYHYVDLMILAGDFNDVEHSPAIKYVRSMGFKDAFWAVGNVQAYTYSAENPHCKIDYIFVKGLADVLSAEIILRSPAYSDHFGLHCKLRLF